MNRRFFLATSIAAAVALTQTSCMGYNLNVFKPPVINGDYINIYEDTTLSGDQIGKQYAIHNGATLDLNGYTLDGCIDGDYIARAFRIYDGTIKNGTIKNYNTGGYAANALQGDYLAALKGVTKTQAALTAAEYRLISNGGQTVENVTFKSIVGEGVYIQAYTTAVTVKNCKFYDTGRMHIYIDHGSADHKITGNYFGSCGYNHVTGREGIALDACRNVEISDNVFKGSMKKRCISIYTNWGELDVERPIACFNKIINNRFYDNHTGISIASRHYRKAAGYKGPDYAEFNHVEGNEFYNIGLPVEDLGTNNTVIL